MQRSFYQTHAKRLLDTACAVLLLLPIAPAMAVLALAIKLTSPGPVLFRQKRTGLHGKPFMMYKFRSMSADNDVHDATSENKTTRVGSLMRRTSLDELPQILNVLKGDMSFIGPRPWITEYHRHLTKRQKLRTSVRPGITGRAQAFGRNALSIHDKIEHDLTYVERVSLREDIRVILQTLKTLGNKSMVEISKHGIHHELAELRAQWTTLYEDEPGRATVRAERDTIEPVSDKHYRSLVTIVVPVYNAEKFISETIQTVQNQTYKYWELMLVDDKSSDKSVQIIRKYAQKDDRIKLIKNKQNSGAAISRNAGIDAAKGKYLAFLDADDLWHPHKLEKQVAFMREKDCAFSFTGYEFADATGKPNGKKVHVPVTITYKQALKNTTISTITVMFDLEMLLKVEIHMPDIRRGQDTATWWKILKIVPYAYGLDENLSIYRRNNATLSSNKYIALKRTWFIYRNIENLSLSQTIYCFTWYGINALKRRIKIG